MIKSGLLEAKSYLFLTATHLTRMRRVYQVMLLAIVKFKSDGDYKMYSDSVKHYSMSGGKL